jgi:hypothetical protein
MRRFGLGFFLSAFWIFVASALTFILVLSNGCPRATQLAFVAIQQRTAENREHGNEAENAHRSGHEPFPPMKPFSDRHFVVVQFPDKRETYRD